MRLFVITLFMICSTMMSFGQNTEAFNELKTQPNRTTHILYDASNSVGKQELSEEAKQNLLVYLDQRLQKPGDRVYVTVVNENSAGRGNSYKLEMKGSIPDFNISTGDKKKNLRRIISTRNQILTEKKRVLRKLFHEYLSIPRNRCETQLLESLVPVSKSLDNEEDGRDIEVLILSDLVQWSSFQKVDHVVENGSFEYAKKQGVAITKKLIQTYNIPQNALEEVNQITVWINLSPGYSKTYGTIMPEYFASVFNTLGYRGEFDVEAGKL